MSLCILDIDFGIIWKFGHHRGMRRHSGEPKDVRRTVGVALGVTVRNATCPSGVYGNRRLNSRWTSELAMTDPYEKRTAHTPCGMLCFWLAAGWPTT